MCGRISIRSFASLASECLDLLSTKATPLEATQGGVASREKPEALHDFTDDEISRLI